MSFVQIPMDPARICDGLSRIGYTPSSAIRDIIDNSVQAGAKHIIVKIVRERELSDSRLNNVKEYLIIDDGLGMNNDQIVNAIALGSSGIDYPPNSLSKFGLGLKAASFSQGEVLEVISSPGEGQDFLKYTVSLPDIRREGKYGATQTPLSEADNALIANHLGEGRGTIIRISGIRKINHPSIRSTLDDLRTKIGVVYYYMMKDDDLKIIIEDQECTPFDVLFTDEANHNGNLDENTWDGKTTRWIEKLTPVTVDAEQGIKVQIEVTQLPHPPTFDRETPGESSKIRDKYMIGARNYGFYVYRNKRLLGWVEKFDLIPQDQDYYAFRGRIIIDETGDDVFNIDVKKSQIHLSEEAFKTLDDISMEYRRKSRRAWQRVGAELRRITNEEGLVLANTIASQVEEIDELPGAVDSEEGFQESERREKELIEEQNDRIKELVALETDLAAPADPTQTADAPEITPDQVKRVITGGQAAPNDKIFLVPNTLDNVLWEPYFDPDKRTCVRINRLHRFARVIYEDNRANGAMHMMVGLMLLQLSSAETYVLRKFVKHNRADIESILAEYRRVSTEMLAQLCRDAGESLPKDE